MVNTIFFALISAFLVSAAFAPIALWWLAVFGYLLFFKVLTKVQFPVFFAFIFGLTANAIILHWSSKYVGWAPWLALSLLQAAFYIPVGLIYRFTHSLRWVAVAILLLEEVRSRFPFGGFGWTRIAFSQVDSPLSKLVSYGGVLLLSTATLILALYFNRFNLRNILMVILLFIFVSVLPENPAGKSDLSLLAIQGNTPSVGLEFNNRAKAVFELHRDATREFAKQRYDAIIWPENAIDIDPANYPEVQRDIDLLLSDLGSPLIAGVVLKRGVGPENASIKYGLDGQEESVYIKRYLTPFGEFMPLRKLAEFISPYAKSVNDFKPGSQLVIHKIANAPIAAIICYEILNDGLVREMAINSSALIIQTNSATFAGTAESAQQLAITRLRAIEHSRSVLSVSTVGISAHIDQNGRVLEESSENIATSLDLSLALSEDQTISGLLGGVAPLLILSLAILWAIRGRDRVSNL